MDFALPAIATEIHDFLHRAAYMNLVDPLSKSPFSISPLSKIRWLAALLSRPAVTRARKAARSSDWSSAYDAYYQALRLVPYSGTIWVQLGHGLGNMGHTDAMQIAYYNATRVQPQSPAGHKHLGLVRYDTILHEQALNSLACALFLAPHDAQLRSLITAREDAVKVEARMAVAALTLADHHPSPPYIGLRATILRTKARAAARRREWSEAERLYRRLTRMRGKDAHAFIQLGHALNEQNKQPEAEDAFRRATAAAPLFADTWLHLGYVLTARKQHLMAREAFAVVNRLAPARREEHPILESADLLLQANAALLADTFLKRKLVRPAGLGPRERSIWLRLATHIERED